MAQIYPWHSTRPGETRYHNNTDCTEGNNIEKRFFVPSNGTGNLTLCDHCARLQSPFFGSLGALARPGIFDKKR